MLGQQKFWVQKNVGQKISGFKKTSLKNRADAIAVLTGFKNGYTSYTPGLVESGRMVRMVVKMVKMIIRMVQMIILIVRIGKPPSILQYYDYISDSTL